MADGTRRALAISSPTHPRSHATAFDALAHAREHLSNTLTHAREHPSSPLAHAREHPSNTLAHAHDPSSDGLSYAGNRDRPRAITLWALEAPEAAPASSPHSDDRE